MESPVFKIINYEAIHRPGFENLNRAWIEKYFWMEPIDFEVLQYPDKYIINTGGYIFMAQFEQQIIGTVALKFVEPGVYEFTKMAVDENFQGQKAGLKLSLHAIEKARELRAHKIILYSNTALLAAIQLYRRLGFTEVPLDGPYKRSNIKMELQLA